MNTTVAANLENTLENRIADKVKEILEDAKDCPKKYVRLILTKDHPVFINPGSGAIGVKEAIITVCKDGKTDVIHFVPETSSVTAIAVMRKDKYVVFAYFSPTTSEEYLFETSRKDRDSISSSFSALLSTEIGTIALLCDNKREKFFYTELYEMSDEPIFFDAMLCTFKEAMAESAKEVCDHGEA